MHNATVQQPFTMVSSYPTIVISQAETTFVIKGKRHNECLLSNGIEWCDQTPNDVRLNLLCHGSRFGCAIDHYYAHNPLVITGRSATRWVLSAPLVRRFFMHPAMTDPYHNSLLSSNTLIDFSEG
ncbi:hypothetical protein TNCV_4993551 [Trichonephila clavipes]|nr:hypothetical protein TNCV_4993551 [Trichonephila clavipes]